MNIDKSHFNNDAVDIQEIQDSIAKATGLASVVSDINGKLLTKPSNLCNICRELVQKDHKDVCPCFINTVNDESTETEPYILECRIGAFWYCLPVANSEGVHTANWYIGQSRNGPLDLSRLKLAGNRNTDKEHLLKKAFDDIPFLEIEELKQAGLALNHIIGLMSLIQEEDETCGTQRGKVMNLINDYLQLTSLQFLRIRSLSDRERRFKSFVETSHDWIWELDKNANFSYVSPRVKNILGYEPEELVGRSGYDLMPPDEAEKISKKFDEYVEKHIPFTNLINVNIHKDGHRVVMESSGWPFFDPDGELLGYRGADRDITERLEREETFNQSERMKTVGGLAAGMAHEINNPLASIIQSEQNIVRRLSPDFPPNRKEAEICNLDLDALSKYLGSRDINTFLENIRGAGKRIHEIVDKLMHISRLNKVEHKKEDLADLIEHATEMVVKEMAPTGSIDLESIKISKEFQVDMPMVKCERTELDLVVQSILANGIEMIGTGFKKKNIDHSPVLRIRLYEKSDFAFIEIEDNGPGISPENQKRIFDPFFSTRDTGKYIGLSLCVSYYIITQNHKGGLWVESQVDEGSKFIIKVPL